jgi:heat shock protein HslJ
MRMNFQHFTPLVIRCIAVIVVFAVLLSACQTADLKTQLVGKKWLLLTYGDPAKPTAIITGTDVTTIFGPDGNVAGSGGCNTYSATYQLVGAKLAVGTIAATMMMCETSISDQETAFFSALQNAQQISFPSADRLQITYKDSTGAQGSLVFGPG